jgi:hypothetical protein
VTVTATARAIRFGSDQAVEDCVIEARSSARFKTAQYLASTAGASALIEVEPVEDKPEAKPAKSKGRR